MRIGFYNVSLDLLDHREVLEKCQSYFDSNACHTIFFLNAHCFNVAQKIPEYAKVLNQSELLLNDGLGIKLASLAIRIPLKENLNGTDLIPRILALAADEKQKVFFLGSQEGVAGRAARKMHHLLPGLQVSGWQSGYFGEKDEQGIIEKINQSQASLLVLGMGVPKQELWAMRNKHRFPHVRIIVAGGAILDFISGHVTRAPLWIRKASMEWVYRLYLEPTRLYKRYTSGIFLFFYYIIKLRARYKAGIRPAHGLD